MHIILHSTYYTVDLKKIEISISMITLRFWLNIKYCTVCKISDWLMLNSSMIIEAKEENTLVFYNKKFTNFHNVEINRFNNFCDKMFSDSFWYILSDNMSVILELNNFRESRIIRLLFFSIIADVQDNYFNIKILKIKLKYRNKFYIYMKIMTNLNVHE